VAPALARHRTSAGPAGTGRSGCAQPGPTL